MKLFRYEDYSKVNRAKEKREPLYTLPEIADRLGVSCSSLTSCMRGKKPEGYPPPPKPAMPRLSNMLGGKPQIYKLSEFKRWMKALQEFNSKRQGDTT
jgi:hypothetical protein